MMHLCIMLYEYWTPLIRIPYIGESYFQISVLLAHPASSIKKPPMGYIVPLNKLRK